MTDLVGAVGSHRGRKDNGTLDTELNVSPRGGSGAVKGTKELMGSISIAHKAEAVLVYIR